MHSFLFFETWNCYHCQVWVPDRNVLKWWSWFLYETVSFLHFSRTERVGIGAQVEGYIARASALQIKSSYLIDSKQKEGGKKLNFHFGSLYADLQLNWKWFEWDSLQRFHKYLNCFTAFDFDHVEHLKYFVRLLSSDHLLTMNRFVESSVDAHSLIRSFGQRLLLASYLLAFIDWLIMYSFIGDAGYSVLLTGFEWEVIWMKFVATFPQVFELFHCIWFRSCRTFEVFRSLVIVWSFVNDESIRWIVGWCPFVNSVIWSAAVVGVLFVSLYWFINYVFIHRLPVLLTGLNFFIIIDLFEKSDQSVPPAREYLNFRHAFSRFFVRFIIIIIPVIFFSVSFSSFFFLFFFFFFFCSWRKMKSTRLRQFGRQKKNTKQNKQHQQRWNISLQFRGGPRYLNRLLWKDSKVEGGLPCALAE